MNSKRKGNGTITLVAEQIKARYSSNVIKMQVIGEKMSSIVRKFFKIYREKKPEDPTPGGPVPIYQSETVGHNEKSQFLWKMIRVGAAALMRDDPNWPLAIEFFEYHSSGTHKVVERLSFSFSQLIDNNFTSVGRMGMCRINKALRDNKNKECRSDQASFLHRLYNERNEHNGGHRD